MATTAGGVTRRLRCGTPSTLQTRGLLNASSGRHGHRAIVNHLFRRNLSRRTIRYTLAMDEHDRQQTVLVVDELVDVEEAARELTLGTSTTWRHIREGRLPAVRVGNSVRVSRSAIRDFQLPYETRSRS